MSATLYIVIEGEDPGFDTFVNGRVLARTEDSMSRLAEQLGVQPILDFFSADQNSMDLLEQEGYRLPNPTGRPLPTQWYPPEHGLRTVNTMLYYLSVNPDHLGRETAAAIAELEEYRVVLEKAAERGLRWHLAVSWR